MDNKKHSYKIDIAEELMQPDMTEVQFYLNEMQKMNNQIVDMQRELNRSMRQSEIMQEELRHSDEIKRDLDIANKANQAKMDFMSRMSHDLRTPMNVIMGLVATTLDEAEDPDVVRQNMANIRFASDYMLGLINDILDMAKIEKGNIELKLEPYSYNDFFLEMQTMFQGQCQAKDIDLIYHDPSFRTVIMADKQRLKQIVFNILSNAVKYTPSGGTIVMETNVIEKNDITNEILVEFRVSDTGIGMSKEFQDHLFEPFVQEDSTITPELKGSGLGLSITKRLVEQMNGTIVIDSQKGVGTTITIQITFPLALHQDDSIANHIKGASEFLQGKTVLLVEDHPMNAMIVRNLLEKKHMNVLYAENGKLAVDAFQSSPLKSIDVILMDIRMPIMTGLQATKAIRDLDRNDALTVPIIALSAHTYPEDIQTSLDAGMNDHLAKPIDPNKLYQTLIHYLK